MATEKEVKTNKETKGSKAKGVLKAILSLDPVLMKYASKLKPFAKPIYYILSILILVEALGAGVGLGFSAFLLFLLNLAIVRLLAEYIQND